MNSITASTSASSMIPERFLCPISMTMMLHPVRTETGHVFERKSILEWCYFGKANCPMSRKPLHPSGFVRDVALEKEIQLWREKHNFPLTSDEEDSDEDDDEDFDSEAEVCRQQREAHVPNMKMAQLMQLRAKVLQNRDNKLARFVQSRRV